MVGHTIKVAYQNVCKGSQNAHTFLQLCWENRIDIVFVGELWRSAEIKNAQFKDGTQLHDAFLLGAGDRHQDLVVGYWKKPITHAVKVLHAGKKEIWIEIGGIKMVGTYRKGDEGTKDIQEWVEN